MKKLLILMFCSGIQFFAQAQDCDLSESLSSVSSLNKAGKFDVAIGLTNKLLKCPTISDDEVFKVLIWQYKLNCNLLKVRAASEVITRADTISVNSGLNRNLEFELLLLENYALNRNDVAFEKLNTKIAERIKARASDRYLQGRYNLVRYFAGDPDLPSNEQIRFLYRALDYLEKADSVSLYYLGNSLRALGNLNRTNGDFDKSANYYKRELELYRRNYESDHFNISICNYNLGGVYYEKLEYELALQHFLDAHKIWNKKYEESSYRMRTLNEAIGDMYWELGNSEKALEYFNYSTPYETKINNDLSEHTITTADSLLESGNYSAAINYYEEAVKWREKTYGKEHLLTGACKNFVARALHSSGETRKALDAYQEAIIILVQDFDNTSWYANPKPEMNVQSNQYLLEALIAKGKLLKELYAQTSELKALIASLETEETAIEFLERIKNTEMSASSKTFWAEKTIQLVDTSIDTALKIKDLTGDDTYLRKAFNFSERSKALLLLTSIYDQEIDSFANIPADIISREKSLKKSINEYVGRIESEEKRCSELREKMLSLYTGKLRSLQNEYDVLINEIAQAYPRYYHLKYKVQISSLEDIRKTLLKDKKQLISYFSGTDSFYVFSITTNDLTVRKIAKSSALLHDIDRLFSLLSYTGERNSDLKMEFIEYVSIAHRLYNSILEPELEAAKDTEALIIIPDGALSYIPFESLLTEKTDVNYRDFRSLPYVLLKYPISYSPSASIAVINQNSRGTSVSYFGFAPNYALETDNEFRKKPVNLKFNQPEVAFAQKLFNGRSWHSGKVTESLLKEYSDQAGILHLAMHAQVDDNHPLLSKLFFNSSKNEDGMLHTYEVYGLQIPAELVILSACNTASGKLQRGEGILSLERAFQYAGSKSLLATLWSVDDAASNKIMQLFLQNIKSGMPKNIALQQAKVHFLQTGNPEKLHPFFWSGYRLTGNTKPIREKSGYILYGLAIGVVFVFITLFLFRRKHKKRQP